MTFNIYRTIKTKKLQCASLRTGVSINKLTMENIYDYLSILSFKVEVDGKSKGSIFFFLDEFTFLAGLVGQSHFVLVTDNERLVVAQAGTGRDEVTADDVLLHTLEVVDAAIDGGLVEDLGGLLEGGCRHEATGLQCSAGDTQ